MGHKLTPKIVLEGTRLTGKTDLAFLLNEHPRIVGPRKYKYHSPLVSGEWCAFTNFPWGRGLINFNPEEEDQAMETYRTWIRLWKLQRYYSWIVDRFHWSTECFQELYRGRIYDLSWVETELAALNFRLVFCRRDPATFPAARAERLKVSGNPSQYDDLSIFLKEQEWMDRRAARAKIPVYTLDVSHGTPEDHANQVADWLEQTGGLWMEQ